MSDNPEALDRCRAAFEAAMTEQKFGSLERFDAANPEHMRGTDEWTEFRVRDYFTWPTEERWRAWRGGWQALAQQAATPTGDLTVPPPMPEPEMYAGLHPDGGHCWIETGDPSDAAMFAADQLTARDAMWAERVAAAARQAATPAPAEMCFTGLDDTAEQQRVRRTAEKAYIKAAFDYARAPVGSRDWTLFWQGWQGALAAAPATPAPAGFVLVPEEPTEEMLAAAHEGDRAYTLRNFGDVMTVQQGPYDHWVAMLAAAPATPAAPPAAQAEPVATWECRRWCKGDAEWSKWLPVSDAYVTRNHGTSGMEFRRAAAPTPAAQAGDALPPTDALRRLWPIVEKAMAGLVFTADKAGEVAADMAAVRDALAARGQAGEREAFEMWANSLQGDARLSLPGTHAAWAGWQARAALKGQPEGQA